MERLINLFIMQSDFFISLTKQHLMISGIAISFSLILGLALGIFISEKEKFAGIVMLVVNVLYTIPSIALFGILIGFTGVGNTTAIISLTIYGLLPIVRNTYIGIKSIDPAIIEASEGMGSTRLQMLLKVKLPIASLVIMSGFRNMVVMIIALTGIVSFIGAGGLGVAIYRGISINDQTMTLAGSIVVAVLALFFDFALQIWENIFSKHKKYSILSLIVMAILILFINVFTFVDTKDDIRIATKPQTENYILGEIQKLVIEEYTDLDVKVTRGIGGGTSNIHPAIVKGDFDLYVEYTGTIWEIVLKNKGLYGDEMIDTLKKQYAKRFGLSIVHNFGFNNTFGIAVRKDVADKYDINTFSDLGRVSNILSFGAEADFFGREDGYDRLVDVYDFDFKEKRDMDSGLKYKAINSGKIDSINIFTTDGMLFNSNIKVLEDDKHIYPSYQAVTVARQDTLDKYPELAVALEKLEGILTDAEMAELNYKVEIGKENLEKVAKDFLIQKGVLK